MCDVTCLLRTAGGRTSVTVYSAVRLSDYNIIDTRSLIPEPAHHTGQRIQFTWSLQAAAPRSDRTTQTRFK